MDYRYFTLQLLYLVEYADYDAQAVLGIGYTGMGYNENDKTTIAEPNTNRIIVSNDIADKFVVGQVISIGTPYIYSNNVAANRTITDIRVYDSNNKAIHFNGASVNIQVGNNIHTVTQKAGSCDSLGMKSGIAGAPKTTGVIYRGVENIFGNILKWVDGIRANNGELYVSTNPADYTSESSETYIGTHTLIGTLPSAKGYITAIGYSPNNPLVMYPISTGEIENSYIPDNYILREQEVLDKGVMVGGMWGSTTNAGLWQMYTTFNATSTYCHYLGSRLLKYQ